MGASWKTKLIHTDAQVPGGFRSLATPICRGSTTLFPRASAVQANWKHDEAGYTYGLYGTPTVVELAARISELENGYKTLITPAGQSAISLIYFSFVRGGEHVLVPESVYGPSRELADQVLSHYGVEVEYYPPLIGTGIARLIRDNTRLIWCESPGSVTMEVQDVPAIVASAHDRGATVALDNTWAAGIHFDAFRHGVDVTMQALTKYVGGHSDLLLGSVTVRDHARYEIVGSTHHRLGLSASPDECSLALRGMKTLAVRLEEIEQSALEVARFLAARPEIETVLHPALPSCPGHDTWRRDFTGSSGVFSIVLKPRLSREDVHRFIDALELFEIGYSWGGVTSLAVPWNLGEARVRFGYGDRLVRLNIGLEDTADLLRDLDQALARLS